MQAEGDLLNFPFEEAGHQRESALFGMWIFLATEVLFFGGMFTAYAVYQFSYGPAFQAAARHQEWYLGFFNTSLLLVSGFTMALAVDAARLGNRRWLLRLFALTWILGALFLAVEGYEYHSKFVQHLVPGLAFNLGQPNPAGTQMFYYLYFLMTGVHMLHMVIGLLLIASYGVWCVFSPHALRRPNGFEVLGLYWAFVDIVWLFLYPLFYLVNPQ